MKFKYFSKITLTNKYKMYFALGMLISYGKLNFNNDLIEHLHPWNHKLSQVPLCSDEETIFWAEQTRNIYLAEERHLTEYIGTTSCFRTFGSQSILSPLLKGIGLFRSVLEIGLGYEGLPFLELQDDGEVFGYHVQGIELVDYFVSKCSNVIIGDILHPSTTMAKALSESGIIRCSNTAIPYFLGEYYSKTRNINEMLHYQRFLSIMEQNLPESGILLLTHSPSDGRTMGEEGFFFQKNNGKLNLQYFMFSIWTDGDKLLYRGNESFTILTGEIESDLIKKPLKKGNYDSPANECIPDFRLRESEFFPATNAMDTINECIRLKNINSFR